MNLLGRLVICLFAAMAWPANAAAPTADLDGTVRAVMSDLRINGALNSDSAWRAAALPYAVPDDIDDLEQWADEPLGTTVGGPPHTTLTKAVGLILDYSIENVTRKESRVGREALMYRRVLFAKRFLIFHFIPIGYYEPLRESSFVKRYWALYNAWGNADDNYRTAVKSGKPKADIDAAQRLLADARRQFDTEGDGPVLTVIMQRYSSIEGRNPAIGWNDARDRYAAGQGRSRQAIGRPGPLAVAEAMSKRTWKPLSGVSPALDYSIVSLSRDWLDEQMFFLWRWDWLASAPVNGEISDGNVCNSALFIFPCIAERAIFIRSDSSTSPPFLIGFLGEAIPKSPRGISGGENDDVIPDPSPSFDNVIGRLRDSTF